MSVIEIIKDLKAAGVRLEEHGDELWCTPLESMPPKLVERVKDHKGELLAILRSGNKPWPSWTATRYLHPV
ncbi:MAG: hypothetical protein VX346_25160 [Planctomycetota bacterium]|nr:hypothetical protein [Planctomycetota bacterium]